MKRGLILMLTFRLCVLLYAQNEILVPLKSNPLLYPNQVSQNQARQASLNLPFADDFNQRGFYPDANKWEDNFVFINNTFGIHPPSLGVATFDGLDANGKPYSELNKDFGAADKLTSLSIDLSTYTISDNIYLSFYWQAGGLGEMPGYQEDYMLLEFLNEEGLWVEQLRIDAPQQVNEFTQEFALVGEEFLHEGFQFRFVAFGNLAGASDHWNIDYVLLDANRNPVFESSVSDLAFVEGNSSYLKNYYQMPFRHFSDDMLKDSIAVLIKNNFNNTVDIVDNYEVKDIQTNTVLKKYEGPSIDIPWQSFKAYQYPKVSLEDVREVSDTTIIQFKYFFETSAENNSPNFVKANNQIIDSLVFANAFAYDDGSAERVYRLINYNFGKIAVKFNAAVQDTLRAVRIYFPDFPNFSGSTKNPLFNIAIYSSIDTTGDGEDIVYREELVEKSDFFVPESEIFNGYAYYTFKPELNDGKDYLLVDGDFYIAIEHEKKNDVDLGIDLNNDHSENMFYNVGEGWFKTQYPGSFMVNAIMGAKLSGVYTSVKDKTVRDLGIKVYPNPVKDILQIQVETSLPYDYQVFDISGKLLQIGKSQQITQLDLSTYPAGLYFLKISSENNTYQGGVKFIKQ